MKVKGNEQPPLPHPPFPSVHVLVHHDDEVVNDATAHLVTRHFCLPVQTFGHVYALDVSDIFQLLQSRGVFQLPFRAIKLPPLPWLELAETGGGTGRG